MAKNPSTVIVTLLLALVAVLPAEAQQQKRNMVRQRLMADMRELKNQLSQLNRTVNQLQNTISQLKRENQSLKNRVLKLERRLDRRPRPRRQDTERTRDERNQQRRNQQQSTVREPSADNSGDEWVTVPGHPYEIRRTPLDHRVIYITTDDTTLTKLAHKYYRDASYWKTIYEVNRDKLPSPDVVPPGVTLILPPLKNLNK